MIAGPEVLAVIAVVAVVLLPLLFTLILVVRDRVRRAFRRGRSPG